MKDPALRKPGLQVRPAGPDIRSRGFQGSFA